MTERRGDIFTKQTESIRFHVSRDEVRWHDRFNKPEGTKAAVIDFGCGVQFVPHLMIETIAVCEILGVDVEGVVGPEYCCGMPYRDGNETSASADNMADASFKRMAALHPLQMVQWCGGALVQFHRRAEGTGPTEVLMIPEMLGRRIAELGDRVPWKKRVEARVLLHKKPNDPMVFKDRGPVMRAYDKYVPPMLERIPGLQVVGELRTLPSGLPCENRIDYSDEEKLRIARAELRMAVDDAFADRLVTDHHQCVREWGKLATPEVPVQQYISVLAEALGVAQPNRVQAHQRTRDLDALVAEARPQWSSWDMSRDEAAEIGAELYRLR